MFLKSMIRNPYIWVASFLCLVIGSCKDFEDCRSQYTSVVCFKFIANDKSNTQPISFDLLELDSSTIKWGDMKDIFYIPLNPVTDSTTFYLHRSKPTIRVDTVTIYYQRYASLISPQCGAQQEYILDSLYTTFAGDSIVNKALRRERDKQNTADVQIFF
jgi:hypothetical protein